MNVYRRLLRILKHRGEDLLLFEIVMRGANVFIGALVAFVINAAIQLKTGAVPINGEFLKWIDGTYLIVLSIATFILLFFAVIEVVGLVHISHSYERGERPTILHAVKFGFRKALGLLHVYGLTSLFIILFAFIVFPIFKIGPTVFRSFSIPSFITDELVVSPVSSLVYILVSAFVLFVLYRLLFTFHIYATRTITLLGACKASWLITSRHRNLRELVTWGVLVPIIVCIVLVILTALLVLGIVSVVNGLILLLVSILPQGLFILFYSAWMFIVTALLSVVFAPFVVSGLTAYLETRNPFALGLDSIRHHNADLPFFKNKFFAWLFRKKKNILIFGVVVFIAFALVARIYLRIFEVSSANPVVIAHRGLSTGAYGAVSTENTIEAFKTSIKNGVQGIETDLQLLNDGTIVFYHDQGVGKYGLPGKLTDYSYQELLERHVPISRFNDLISLPEFNCNTQWLFEIKDYTPIAEQLPIALKLSEVVSTKDMSSCVYVGSFNFAAVSQFKDTFPKLKTNLYVFNAVGNISSRIDLTKIDMLSIEESLVTNRIVRAFREVHKPVFVWTVNNVGSVETLKQLGIAGVITDVPLDMATHLKYLESIDKGSHTQVIELFGKTFIFDLRDMWQFKLKYSI